MGTTKQIVNTPCSLSLHVDSISSHDRQINCCRKVVFYGSPLVPKQDINYDG